MREARDAEDEPQRIRGRALCNQQWIIRAPHSFPIRCSPHAGNLSHAEFAKGITGRTRTQRFPDLQQHLEAQPALELLMVNPLLSMDSGRLCACGMKMPEESVSL